MSDAPHAEAPRPEASAGVPPAPLPTAGEDAFAAAVHAAQADIASGVERAGLRNDPFRYPLAALSTALGLFPSFLRRIDGAVDRARSPVTAEDLARLEKAAATGADRRAADLARAHNLRTLLAYGGGTMALILVAATVAFFWGRAAANVAVRETEQRLATAFADGPAAAATWAVLMENNDITRAMGYCTGPRSYADQAGRRVCLVPLYVEPRGRAAPAVQ